MQRLRTSLDPLGNGPRSSLLDGETVQFLAVASDLADVEAPAANVHDRERVHLRDELVGERLPGVRGRSCCSGS